MTDRERQMISTYIPSPSDPELGFMDYYMMDSADRVIRGLECCVVSDPDAKRSCDECPYNHSGIISNAPCANGLMAQSLTLIKDLIVEVEIWKKRYKFECVERKTTENHNYEPNLVRLLTSEEIGAVLEKEETS